MTLFDPQTAVLPPARPIDDPEPVRSGTALLLALLAGALVVLLSAAVFIAETVARAEAERTVADGVRSAWAISGSERVRVDIPGSILVQEALGRFDRVDATVFSLPTGRANADLTVSLEGLRGTDGGWDADRLSAAMTLTAPQATALLVPAEEQGRVRIDFSGGDMVVGGAMPGATDTSVTMTPRFEDGRLGVALSAVTVNGATLSAEQVQAQTGADPAATGPAPLCLAETVPGFLHPRDVRIADGRLRIEFDIDRDASETDAGRRPGSCP